MSGHAVRVAIAGIGVVSPYGVGRDRFWQQVSRGCSATRGSGAGLIDVADRRYYEFFNDGWKRVTPYAIPVSSVGMISSEISIALAWQGISHVISTGCWRARTGPAQRHFWSSERF